MSAEEDQQSQSGYDEQAGGPGAPTPLAALEACTLCLVITRLEYD